MEYIGLLDQGELNNFLQVGSFCIAVKMDYEQEQEHIQRLINEVFPEKQPEEITGGDYSDNKDHVSESEHNTSTEISADSSEFDDETSDIDSNVIFGLTILKREMIENYWTIFHQFETNLSHSFIIAKRIIALLELRQVSSSSKIRNKSSFVRDRAYLLAFRTKPIRVREKIMGYLVASKRFNVPRSTLFDYVRSISEPTKAVKSKLGRKPILPASLEEKLVDYVLMMERKYFG
ncbi:hypothetical protein ANN_10757 [Periplaneta americana]|uniref:Uncharacterized protein n=1 Tax=Periplaneta americana TaxID=6978 RepID=A0ABQ8T363_PERAM|nr:hypothetical protein ANN_10757 [Periplaneta americana]